MSELLYIDKDNSIDLLLKADGVAQDLSSVTRMKLVLGDYVRDVTEFIEGYEIDSDTYPTAFDWDTGTTGKVVISPGNAAAALGISAGKYTAFLVVYDPTNTDGIVWPDTEMTIYVRNID